MSGYSFDLAGRVALVTGASSGLGHRFARILAASGAKVVIGARRVALLDALKAQIEADGGVALAVPIDVADEASTIAAYDAAQAAFGPVDTIVANAGINITGSALGMAAADFDRLVAVNLRGVFLTVREGARRMVAAGSAERHHGRITIVSSTTAHHASPGIAAYCATKAAIAQLGRALAKDWATKGINVNILCPGYVATELNEKIWDTPMGKKLLDGFPRSRVMDGDALDPMLLYLSSGACRQVTGSVFTIDDGQTL
jgi:NAD(P)-dependent dehydrogenase (short-subunit alcohol dehydrogenase family)